MTVVPDGWALHTPHDISGLANDALVIGPFGSNLRTSDYRDEGVPLIFVKDIRAEDFSRPRAYVSNDKAAELASHQVLPGDILVTKMGDPPGDAALYDGDVPGIITADCIRLRSAPGFDRRFLLHALRAPDARRQINAITSGAAQQKVSLDRFRTRVHIPVPPLAEQKRIAALLDRIDTLRAMRRQAIALFGDLSNSIFYEMFGDPRSNPMAWKTCEFGSLISLGPQNGLYKPSGDYGSGVPILRIDGFQQGDLRDFSEWRMVRADRGEVERYGLANRDIVVNRVNSRSHLGKSVMVAGINGDAVFESNMMRLRVDEGAVLPVYVERFLGTPFIKGKVLEAAKDAVNQSSINQGDVKGLPFNVPPIELQQQFERRVGIVERQKSFHRAHLATLDELFTSLQQRAFAGELWDHEAA